MKLIYTLIFSFFSFGLIAETSEQYTYRAEFFFGNINEGKSYEDVKNQNMEYLKFLKENDLKYGRALFVPIWAGETKYDIIQYGYWPSGQEQYKEWGAYMNKYPAWASENSEFEDEAVEDGRSISMFGVRARGIRVPNEEYDRFKFVDFRQCSFTSNGNMENLLDLNSRVESSEREMGNRAGYGVHYLRPYRGFDSDIDYDFVIMRHYYNAKSRADIVTSTPSYREMMEKEGYWKEFRENVNCGSQSTYRVEWLYNSDS